MSGLSHTYFLGLSAVGFNYLWGELIRNGAAQAIGAVRRGGVFPDGTIVRRTFTGLPGLDSYVLSPVIFYDGVTNGQNLAHRLLLVSLFSTMQSTSVCMLASGWRKGRRKWYSTLEYIAWGVLNQAWGAAFVYPLWCFFNAQYLLDGNGDNTIGPMEGEETQALLASTILSCAAPMMLIYPAYFRCSSRTRQGLIALYRIVPVALGLLQPLISNLLKWFSREAISQEQAKHYARASLALSGTYSAFCHLYALTASLLSSRTSVGEVFLPPSTVVEKSSTSIIADGAHKFLQYDWIVVAAALIPFAYLAMHSGGKGERVRSLENPVIRIDFRVASACQGSRNLIGCSSLNLAVSEESRPFETRYGILTERQSRSEPSLSISCPRLRSTAHATYAASVYTSRVCYGSAKDVLGYSSPSQKCYHPDWHRRIRHEFPIWQLHVQERQ